MADELAIFILMDGTEEVRPVQAHLDNVEVRYLYDGDNIFDAVGPLVAKITFERNALRRIQRNRRGGDEVLPIFLAYEATPRWVSLVIRQDALRRELEEITEELYQQLKQSAG